LAGEVLKGDPQTPFREGISDGAPVMNASSFSERWHLYPHRGEILAPTYRRNFSRAESKYQGYGFPLMMQAGLRIHLIIAL
jgi:hypothetical protein